jgi:hypothetical protein
VRTSLLPSAASFSISQRPRTCPPRPRRFCWLAVVTGYAGPSPRLQPMVFPPSGSVLPAGRPATPCRQPEAGCVFRALATPLPDSGGNEISLLRRCACNQACGAERLGRGKRAPHCASTAVAAVTCRLLPPFTRTAGGSDLLPLGDSAGEGTACLAGLPRALPPLPPLPAPNFPRPGFGSAGCHCRPSAAAASFSAGPEPSAPMM